MTGIMDLRARTSGWSASVVGLALLVIAINLVVAWRIDADLRQKELENAEGYGRQMLTAFADHAVRLLDYGDSQLRAARAIYQRLGGSEDFREFLATTKALHSESIIVATTFSDHDGQIVFDSEKSQVPNVIAADLDYFRYFQTHEDDVPYIDPTRLGRVWQKYLFRIVRRLSRNGQFDGVAILNMRPEHLANFTHQFDLGPNVAYAILTLDHRLIVRQPMAPETAYGERQDDLELWRHLPTAFAGRYWSTSTFDGRRRLYLYQKLPDYPLVVLVGIDEQDMLNHFAEARIPNIQQAAGFTLVTIVLCSLVVLILRKSSTLERTNATLEQSELRLSRAMEATSDGIWEWDIASGGGYFSPAYYRMLGYEVGEFASTAESWLELIHPEDRKRALAANQECIDNKVDSFATEFRMRKKDGGWCWILGRGKAVKRDSSGKALLMIGTHADITNRKQLEDQVRELALHDELTKLANRRLLNERLSQAMAVSRHSGDHGAVMFLDLDNLKLLNDTHGHETGDLLLIEAANRLKGCVREMDTVARFGGDEFVVMLSELGVDRAESARRAGIIAEKVRVALAQSYVLETPHAGKSETAIVHHCTASIGVALFSKDGASLDNILKWADTAMYRAKETGGNLIRFHDSEARAIA
jgi:diguanylate cyclase (GGDEF)-like protein/PAS domain S-box-containing protein